MRVLAFALVAAGVSACAAIAGVSDYADCTQGGCDDGGAWTVTPGTDARVEASYSSERIATSDAGASVIDIDTGAPPGAGSGSDDGSGAGGDDGGGAGSGASDGASGSSTGSSGGSGSSTGSSSGSGSSAGSSSGSGSSAGSSSGSGSSAGSSSGSGSSSGGQACVASACPACPVSRGLNTCCKNATTCGCQFTPFAPCS